MKLSGRVEKWVIGVLGVVCAVVLAKMVVQLSGLRGGGGRVSASTAAAVKGALGKGGRAGDELSRYDSVVRLDLLKQLQDRPLPELDRSPFEFEAAPVRPAPAPASTAAAPPPAQPPAPPPISVKPMGYSETAGGVREVYMSEEDQVYVVHEGETIAGKYKILKITPKIVTVEDVTSHQTADLPIPE
jgi:hypothetical protein